MTTYCIVPKLLLHLCLGAQWFSGRVLNSRPRGRGFVPRRRHCVASLSKNINPSLVLIQPRKTRSFLTGRLLMRCKNQIKETKHLCLDIGTFFFLSFSILLRATILHFLIASSVQIINDGSPILDKQVTMQQQYCSRWGRFMGRVCDYLLIYICIQETSS